MRLAAVAAVALALALGGCEPMTPQQVAERKSQNPFFDTEVYHDDGRGVTCWKSRDPRGGISCLPDWMLTKPSKPAEPDKCLVKDLGKSEACRKLFAEPVPGARS